MDRTGFVRWYLPAILWGLTIIILTSIPRLAPPDLGFEMEDKLAHLVVYFIFQGLLIRGMARGYFAKGAVILKASLFSLVFGAVDEIHQLFIPGRAGDPFDFIADSIGILLAGLSFFLIKRIVAKKKNSTGYEL